MGLRAFLMGNAPRLQSLNSLRSSCQMTRVWGKDGVCLARCETFCTLGLIGWEGAFDGLQALETPNPRSIMTCFRNLFYTCCELSALSGREIAGMWTKSTPSLTMLPILVPGTQRA